MKNLYEIIFKNFLTASLIPIIVVEIFLIGTIFVLSLSQNHQSEEELEKIVLSSYKYVLDEKSEDIHNLFLSIKKDLNYTKTYIEANLNNKESFANLNLTYKDGFFVENTKGKNEIYTTNLDSISKNNQQIINALNASRLYLKESVTSNKKFINSAWVNIGKTYSLAYPAIDVFADVPQDLDVTIHPFYTDANSSNNPNKQVLFTPTYKESWAPELSEFGAFITPIYLNNSFSGVIGFNITINELKNILKEGAPQYGGILMLVDENGNLIASSDEELVFQNFGVHSYAYKCENQTKDTKEFLSKIDFASYVAENDIVRAKPVDGSSLALILYGKHETIFSGIEENYAQTNGIAYLVLFFIIMFLILFFMYSINAIKDIAKKISKPIQDLAIFSNNLGLNENIHFKDSEILEINTLFNNFENANKNLTKLITRDDLTGLYNRRKLINDIAELANDTSLVVIDINKFSHIISVYGMDAGDKVLVEVANRLLKFCKPELNVYQLEGDSYAILTPNATEEFLDALIADITKDVFAYNGIDIDIHVTLGILHECQKRNAPLLKAEMALNEARTKNYGKYIFYSEELATHKEFEKNIQWGNKIKLALKEGRIVSFFQPIYNFHTNKVEKFESLVRLIEDGRPISPFFFLDAAKNVGLLHSITKAVVINTFNVAKKYPDIQFSINVSFSDFADEDFYGFLKSSLEEYGIKANQITLELLETEAVDSEIDPKIAISRLQEAGFKVAIDDFGSGYSNYSHLLNMDVDLLKIDGQFIKHIITDKKSEKITLAMLEFSKLLNTKTVAEFVADEDIFKKVGELGVDFAQGYFIAPPLQASEIDSILDWKYKPSV